jgi:hypothetical protein
LWNLQGSVGGGQRVGGEISTEYPITPGSLDR